MIKTILQHPFAFALSLLVHSVLVGIMVISFDWSSKEQPKINVVQATTVDEKKVEQQIKKLKQAEQQKIKAEEARRNKLESEADKARRKRQAEEQRLADARKQREEESRKRKAIEQQRKEEEKRVAQIEEKKQQLEANRREVEQQRREEEIRLAQVREEQQRADEDRRMKEQIEQERKQREADAKRRKEELEAEEKRRQAEIAADQARITAESDRIAQTEVEKYTALIQQKIESKWNIPPTSKPGLKSIVYVRLIPGGDVLHVEIIKSSGDPIFDRSIETAVLAAKPLPLPDDMNLFERFRELKLPFTRPEKK